MDSLNISKKSDAMLYVRDMVTKSFVEDIMVFTVGEYLDNMDSAVDEIYRHFKGDRIVVRSVYRRENGNILTKTGRYESILNIKSGDKKTVADALKKVADSYLNVAFGAEKKEKAKSENILIQRQATDIAVLGSVYTRDMLFNRPYYVVDYEENTGNLGNSTGKVKWVARNASREFVNERFYQLIEAVKEIEKLYDAEALEIEFAIDNTDNIIIFQVRSLPEIEYRPRVLTDHEFYDTKSFAKCTYLDEYHVLSDMACFGLTESLGTNPRPLDYSLYKELITTEAWEQGISKLGYARSESEIMLKIGNKPYISVNSAFDGLIPAEIDNKLKYKLNEYYVDKLFKKKNAHSKIESEIVFCVYDFSLPDKINELYSADFTGDEINELKASLKLLTENIINNYQMYYQEDIDSTDILTGFRRELRTHNPLDETNAMKLYGYISSLVEQIKKNGTPQFVRQSRCALIAGLFLKSLIEKEYFTKQDILEFLAAIENTATGFERDFDLYSTGKMSLAEFDKKYGHLRLGAFDIRTENYRKMYRELKDKSILDTKVMPEPKPAVLDKEILQKAIDEAGLAVTADSLHSFLIDTIANKEYFRYENIKSFGLILEIITALGNSMGIAKEDMSYLEIHDLLSYHSRETYIQDISFRRDMYHANVYLMLPEVIFGVGDIDVINQTEGDAIYITDKIVEAEVVDLKDDEFRNIDGKIVALSTVNSGYNWIFTRNIAGFVAKYGDANSAMARRCAKLGIPAMIGCGEKIYGKVVRMEKIRLDCAAKKVFEV